MSTKNSDSQPNPRGAGDRPHELNNMWSPDSPTLGPGDLGRADTAGGEGQGRRGAQGYGNSAEYQSTNGEPDRQQLGVQGSPEYGVYDIGGLSPDGFKRESSGTDEDADFGTRHWGHGEYLGDDSRKVEVPPGPEVQPANLIERVGETVGRFFGVEPKV